MATALQACLLLGVFIPLASFVFLAFFGSKLGGAARRHEHAHHENSHGHAEHGHPAAAAPGEPLAGWVATAAIAASLILALIATFIWAGGDGESRRAWSEQAAHGAALWTNLGSVPIHFGVNLDSLTVITFLMVTICSTCIHVFSVGYMAGDPRFARFFCFLSLFCFSMLGLVIARSLLFLFIFWELVGVCSYFLIGFWFEKKSASNAAIKAFVVNRVGDFGFVIGLGLCLVYLGTLSLDSAPAVFEAGARAAGWSSTELSAAAAAVPAEQAAHAARLFTTLLWGVPLATWLGIGLFCGAIGKSAQFPLQVWLPDAMEGPTPVSALIHAATMVAAGVYLVARVFLLLTPGAQMFIAVVGCITLTMAALIAIVQTDIKRVLAYSTLSQLGYMVFGLGVGAWVGALYHLLTHAFFKALLFLGSGQVIAGCHHEQDLRKMGGLASKMPNTAIAFLIAVLAISGAGLPWLNVGLGGYFSKDEILAVAFYRHFNADKPAAEHAAGERAAGDVAALGSGVPVLLAANESAHAAQSHGDDPQAGHAAARPAPHAAPPVSRVPAALFWLPIVIAYVTPFYMGRCFILAFLGRPRDEHIHAHARETPIMYRPLLVLAGLTVVSSIPVFLFRPFVAHAAPGHAPLVPAISGDDHALHAAHQWLPAIVGFAWVVGLGSAWLLYRNGLALAERIRRAPVVHLLHHVLWNKFYFDHVYGFVLVGGTKVVAVICRLFDNWVIDGVINNAAYVFERLARFSGVVLDNRGVDGAVNGLGGGLWSLGGLLRRFQTGLARNYILLAALGVCALVVAVLSGGQASWALALFVAAAAALLTPWEQVRRGLMGER
ncbi:MAG: NADH-quinone oxidoreductase subunit L [Phycisphaerae bacterium]|jgi:NADH:ubiquinone oxidoreductase subunit 5 (subunit L)/multisubunit Na+/H+ antiporter MnhA subunit